MALISISVGELFERAKEFNLLPENIKKMYVDKNAIVTDMDFGRFIPDLKMKISFDYFDGGRAIFNILSPAIVKLPAKLIKKDIYEGIVLVEKGKLIIDLNKAIEKKTDRVKIKDLDFINEIFTIKI